MDKIRRLVRKSNSREDGFTLIEVLVAVAILSIIAIGIYSALHSGIANTVNEDEKATARSLAMAQMEYVKQLKVSYAENPNWEDPPDSYDPDPYVMSETRYSGYTVTIDASPMDEENRSAVLQLITVTVFLDGEEVYVLEGSKLVTGDSYWTTPPAET